jgi:hypothetical protein
VRSERADALRSERQCAFASNRVMCQLSARLDVWVCLWPLFKKNCLTSSLAVFHRRIPTRGISTCTPSIDGVNRHAHLFDGLLMQARDAGSVAASRIAAMRGGRS